MGRVTGWFDCAREGMLWVTCVCALLFALIAGIGCTITVRERDLFHPRRESVVPDEIDRRNVEIFAHDSTRLRGWMLRPPQAEGLVLWLYGNGETVRDSEDWIYWLAGNLRMNVLAVDYRGYGFSEGVPTVEALQRDVLTVYDAIASSEEALSGPLLAYGFSLGSLVAIHLAAERHVDGLILVATGTSVEEIVPAWRKRIPRPARWFVRVRPTEDLLALPRPVDRISGVAAPSLFVHGEHDDVIPVELGMRMFEASGAVYRRWCLVPGAGHATRIRATSAGECLREFVEYVRAARGVDAAR